MAQKGGPCYRGQRLLDKRTLSSCRWPRQRSTTVPETSCFARPAWNPTDTPVAPPLGELSPKVTERARTLTKNRRRSDSIALPKRQLIAAWRLPGAGLALSVIACAMPLPGLRLPASASLPLASCWPRPQQLLPVSATGGGRRRCSQGERLWLAEGAPISTTYDENMNKNPKKPYRSRSRSAIIFYACYKNLK